MPAKTISLSDICIPLALFRCVQAYEKGEGMFFNAAVFREFCTKVYLFPFRLFPLNLGVQWVHLFPPRKTFGQFWGLHLPAVFLKDCFLFET